jgi:glycerol-1-phosphate dehydrogenase [NAD(P)+]
MNDHMSIYVGDQAIEEFIQFCKQGNFSHFFLIADQNTYNALGKRVFQSLQEQGWDVLTQILNPEHLHTDDFSITRVLATYDAEPRLFVAVGSGTITDITRFTSHRSRNPFVSFPSAASVDAYTSKNAPTTVGGLKGSIYCQAPIAIFTDLPTICESPKFLTASGFGDSISKFTSSSDWKFTQLIWGSAFDEGIYRNALHAAKQSASVVAGIQRADPQSMAKLMDSQFESGFCMADFANSAPASGGEHHIAHMWEMMFHWDKREGLFHGHAVGVATLIEAEWYERLRALSKDEAAALLGQAVVPDKDFQEQQIRQTLPLIADELIKSHPIYIQLADPKVLNTCKQRMLDSWEEIQTAASNVPSAQQVYDWLKLLGAPTTPSELGITPCQVETAKEFGLYLRERFSMNIIRKLFGW